MKEVLGHGPIPSPVVLLGEAPGINEVLYGKPFVGESGDELDRMLREVGLNRKDMYVTNVFKIQPPGNDVQWFFTTRTDPEACTDLPARNGKYLRSEFLESFRSLLPELVSVGPRIVIALGATALWALLGQSKISAFVGTLHGPTDERPFYVLPTFHPAAVLRQWSYRKTVIANLAKAQEFLETSPVRPKSLEERFRLIVNPTLDQVRAFCRRAHDAAEMAVDIETAHGQIRTIAFCLASSPNSAFCVPFWEPPAKSYWPNLSTEIEAWKCVRFALSGDGTKVYHNGAYDLQWLWRGYGIPTNGPIEDTMLAHHALEPELPKGLGVLAATYLNIPEWKTSRMGSAKDEE